MSALSEQELINCRRPFCKLYIKLSLEIPEDVRNLYLKSVENHNNNTFKVIFGHERGFVKKLSPETLTFDAGFDLFAPCELSVSPNELIKINHNIQTSMLLINPQFNNSCGIPVGYYLYPRSSTGTKTPLRLANSVGIIDSGYRGNIIAAFDNKSDQQFNIEKGQRLVQICPPNLEYPLWVSLVYTLGETERGEGGFGSTGM